MIESVAGLTAYVDETAATLPDGQLLYGLAVVLTEPADDDVFAEQLGKLLHAGRSFLRYHDETADRRVLIARAAAALPMAGGIIVTRVTSGERQERARARLFAALLPRLEHTEHVTRVVIESRAGSDKLDSRTRDRLRRSRQISSMLHIDHVPKRGDARLWLADLLAGAYVGAVVRGERQPWDILTGAHLIDVVSIP